MSWLLLGVARQLFPHRDEDDRGRDDPVAAWRAEWGPAATQLIIVSLVATASVVGFRLSTRAPAQVVVLVLNVFGLLLTSPLIVRLARGGSRLALLVPVPWLLAAVLALAGQPGPAFTAITGAQVVSLGLIWAGEAVTDELLTYFYAHPAILTCLTFVGLILLGTLFLSFPAASATGERIGPVDALFTSTSACCVTGLIVLDTPRAFSTFGHVVILALIQVGGLNIMVLSTFAALALGRRLGLRGELALGQVLDLPTHRTAHDVTRFIVLATIVLEAIGAVALTVSFAMHGATSVGDAVWRGVFHSISAFCNAGFALQSDNVVCLQRDPFALFVIGSLICLGGLGFTVLATGWARLRRQGGPLALQSRLVLLVTALLIVAGAALYAVGEWNASLAGLPWFDKLVNATFQSVSARTAGFNSVDMTKLTSPTLLAFCILMIIGASPGGTGGGIKTTTFAVLVGTVISAVRGGAPIVLFRRTIPVALAYRAAAVLMATLATLLIGLFILLWTQTPSFRALLFEVCSALGTVGLSVGATGALDTLGKLVIVAVMYAGRVGPLTLVLLVGQPSPGRLGYPDAKLMIG
jgi:trk system potassium uptake protein TrkH